MFWVGVPLLLVGLYALFGFLLAPRLIRSGMQDYVAEHYDRRLDVGEVKLNPFTLELIIRDLRMPDTDGAPLLSFRQLLVDLNLASVWKLAPSFHAIVLDEPFTHVVIRKNGALNLADLAKPFETREPPAEPEKPTRLFIDRFSVRGGRTMFEDLTGAKPFRADLRPITFELYDFSTTEHTGNRYGLSGASAEGERFAWNGTLRMNPLASQGRFELADVKVRTLWSYLSENLQFETSSGTLALKGTYDLDAAGEAVGLKAKVDELAVADLKLRPKGAGEDLVELARVEVRDTAVDADKRTITVGNVQLAGGDVRAWLDGQGRLNLLDLTEPAGAGAGPAVAGRPESAKAAAPAASESTGADGGGAAQVAVANAPGANTAEPAPSAQGSKEAAEGSSKEGEWVVSAPDISVSGIRVAFEDRQVTPVVALAFHDIDVHIAGFNTTPGTEFDVKASMGIDESGKLETTAKVTPETGAAKADVQLAKLDLRTFQPYITRQAQLTLRSGQLGTKLQVERAANGSLAADGDIEVTGLHTLDNERLDFVKWERMRVSRMRYRSEPQSLKIASIQAYAPYARVIIDKDRTVNVADVLTPAQAPLPQPVEGANDKDSRGRQSDEAHGKGRDDSSDDATDDAKAGPRDEENGDAKGGQKPAAVRVADRKAVDDAPHKAKASGGKASGSRNAPAGGADGTMPITIGTVRITNGSANFADLWIQPNFAVGIQQLNGTIEGLSSAPDSRAKIDLEGKVDRYAPALIKGEVNVFSAAAFSEIKMSFKGVEMTTATPYSGHFAGYKIEKGKLSVDLDYRVHDRQLEAGHRFVIDQLQLGERVESPDAVNLPVRLAVALLKDRNGVIDVDLPVSGSLDDPKFRIGPLIWKAVVNLLTKVVTAPFAMLGRMFGGGEDMNLIEFDPGSATLDDEARKRLASLMNALKERPQLQLDVPMVFSPELDGATLASQKLQAALLETKAAEGSRKRDSGKPVDPAVLDDPAERFRLLVALHRAQLGKDAPLPPAAQALEAAGRRKDEAQLPAASQELETELLARMQPSQAELEALGKQRSDAIQAELLGSGEVDATRVFVITAPQQREKPEAPVPPSGPAQPEGSPGAPADSSPRVAGGPGPPGSSATPPSEGAARGGEVKRDAQTAANEPKPEGPASGSEAEPGAPQPAKGVQPETPPDAPQGKRIQVAMSLK